MPIEGLSGETEKAGSGGGQTLPVNGAYEVIAVEATKNDFGDDILNLSLLGDGADDIATLKYRYKLTPSGKINANTNGGKLADAFNALQIEDWDVEGRTFNFEAETFTLEGGDRAGVVYQVFLPRSVVEAGTASAASTNGMSEYTPAAIAALLEILEEPKSFATVFKEAAGNSDIAADSKLMTDITNKKFAANIPGIKLEGQKYSIE